jgi:hypothetical protein
MGSVLTAPAQFADTKSYFRYSDLWASRHNAETDGTLQQPRARGHRGWAPCIAAEKSTGYFGNAAAASSCRRQGLALIALVNTPSIRLLSQQKQAQRTRQPMLCNSLV